MAGEQFKKGAINWLLNNPTAEKFVNRLMQKEELSFGEAVKKAMAQREAGILDKAGALSSAQKKQVSQDVTGGKTVAEAVKHATTPAPAHEPEFPRTHPYQGPATAAEQREIEGPAIKAAQQDLDAVHAHLGPLPGPPAPSVTPAVNPVAAGPKSGSLMNKVNQYGKLAAGGGLALAGLGAVSGTGQEPEAARSKYVTEKRGIPTLGEDGRTLKDTVKAATAPEQEEKKVTLEQIANMLPENQIYGPPSSAQFSGPPSSAQLKPEEKKVTPEQIATMLPENQMKPEKKKAATKEEKEEGGEGEEGEEGEEEQTPVQKILSHFSDKLKETRGGLKKDLEGQLDKMQTLETTYRTEAKEAKDSVARQELAEKMGHALAQLGAGMQGIKTGVDMTSGLKFDKTDWNKRYETALDELKANLTDLREKRQEARLTSQEAMRETEREAERGMSLATQEQIRGEDRTERAKEKKDQLDAAAALRKEDIAFRGQESKLQRDWEQKKFGDTIEFKKEALDWNEQQRNLDREFKKGALHWNEQQRNLDRKSKEKIAQFKASVEQSAVDKKLTEQDQASQDAASGSLLGAWAAVDDAEGPKEKSLAEKRAMQLESDLRVTKYLTPTAIQQARKTAQGTPSTLWNFWKGKEGDISAAERQLNIGRIVRTGGASQASAPVAPTNQASAGQAPAVGGMVNMVAPDGRRLKVPADKVQELESQGAKRA